MTDYTPLHPVMREDFTEYDWMNVDWWVMRARALAARYIHSDEGQAELRQQGKEQEKGGDHD